MTSSAPPPRGDRWLALLFHAAVFLIVAATVHLVSILLLPRWAEHDAYRGIADLAQKPLQTVAGPTMTDAVLPYRDPAMATAFCLYDLTNGPVRVGIDVGDARFLTLSVHSRHGRPFYALTDRSASGGAIGLTLMTAAQKTAAEAQDPEDEPVQDLRVAAPEPKGFVEVQVLAQDPDAMAAAEARAARLGCATAKPN